MKRKISFTTEDGTIYECGVKQVRFEDDGTPRVKFEIIDWISRGVLQRIEGEWMQLEGDILQEHIEPIGNSLRENFDT